MPNWCKNYLEISGPAEDLERFDIQFKRSGIDVRYDHERLLKEHLYRFDSSKYLICKFYDYDDTVLVKYIKEIKPLKKYSFTAFKMPPLEFFLNDHNALFSMQDYWGTKWDLYDMVTNGFCMDEPEITYDYLTAYGPSDLVVKEMIKHYPKLRFDYEYEEGGSMIAGKIKAFNGEIFEEKHVLSDGFRKFSKEDLLKEMTPCPHCNEYLFESELLLEHCPICEGLLPKEK